MAYHKRQVDCPRCAGESALPGDAEAGRTLMQVRGRGLPGALQHGSCEAGRWVRGCAQERLGQTGADLSAVWLVPVTYPLRALVSSSIKWVMVVTTPEMLGGSAPCLMCIRRFPAEEAPAQRELHALPRFLWRTGLPAGEMPAAAQTKEAALLLTGEHAGCPFSGRRAGT